MARGRWSNYSPPFEVMKGMRAYTAEPARASSVDLEPPTIRMSQIIGGRRPVVLRMPRGYLIVGGLGLFALVMLSFWIGHSRGYKRGQENGGQNGQAMTSGMKLGPGSGSLAVAGQGATSMGNGSANGPSGGQNQVSIPQARTVLASNGDLVVGPTSRSRDPGVIIKLERATGADVDMREENRSYFILVHSDERYARRIVQYLWQEGVEAAAVQRHNGRPFMVVALQGFTTEEKGTADFRAYQRFLKDLGRAWEANYDSTKRWDDLYPSVYKGGKVNSVIRKARS
jgi:hypothetical protein